MYVEKSLDGLDVLELSGWFGVFASKVGDFVPVLASPELLLASERLFVVECERFGWRRERELRLG